MENTPLKTKEEVKSTPIVDLEIFAENIICATSPLRARLRAHDEEIIPTNNHIKELRRLTVFFLMQHKVHIDKLASMCKADNYFKTLRNEGSFDFIDIIENLSPEIEVKFVKSFGKPKNKLAFQILAILDITLSIHNIESIFSKLSTHSSIRRQESEWLTRETLLIMRNLGFFLFTRRTISRDSIDKEIATAIHFERDSNANKMSHIRDYDAKRYNESSEYTNIQRNAWFAQHFIPYIPLMRGRSKGGKFNIKDRFIPFLERLMADTGANDLPSVCAAIKDTCKDTEPLHPGEMLFHWDDEPDARTVRAVWLNNKKERKDEKIALKTLDNYIKQIRRKSQKND